MFAMFDSPQRRQPFAVRTSVILGFAAVQVHGLRDWLVPIDDARALFERFPGRKVMLELPGRHNDVGFADDALSRALGQFWPNPQAGVRERESPERTLGVIGQS